MPVKFKCLLAEKSDRGHRVAFAELPEERLPQGDVDIDVTHSTLNYKDGLALSGKAPVIRDYPMVPGIDLAGVVRSSRDSSFSPGEAVAVTGRGLGETHFGGYATRARVKADWVIRLAPPLTPARAMAVGTAGYTAMLCVSALEDQGVTPQSGPIAVTGASGGVGSMAIMFLSRLGYTVAAVTGRPEEAEFLRRLGASEILDRADFAAPVAVSRSMAKMRWAGAVDAAGSHTLANVISQTCCDGVVTACGLAHGMDLSTSVAPFILRGVRLIGIESVRCPTARMHRAWERVARDIDIDKLDALTEHMPFANLPRAAEDILAGRVRGRLVVDIA